MNCNDTMEQVDVEVTFTLPDFIIDPNQPPIADSSTATYFSTPDILSFDGSLHGGLIGTNPTAPNGTDTYFAVLVGGKNGFPISELADPAFDDTIAARIRNQNGLIRAQEYNTQGRIAASGEVAARKLSGMATDSYRTRLVQTIVSTRVVQCLLGVMGVLAIISYFSMDSRQVLPKNPCSIAGVASMLVDSEILKDDTILALAWLESDRKLRKAGILDRRYTAKLGWFDPKNTRQSAEQPTAVDNAVRHTIRRKPTPSAMKRFGVDLIKRNDKTAESSELIPW